MATSDVSTWNPAVVQIITDALRDLDVIDSQEEPDASMYAEGIRKLNGIIKGLETQTIHVWTEEQAILFLQPNQQRYTLGSSDITDPNAHCSDANDWTQLTLQQSMAALSTTILVSAAGLPAFLAYLITEVGEPIVTGDGELIYGSGVDLTLGTAVGYELGIVLDSGYTFWTTITAIESTGDNFTITFANPLPSSASSGNFAFSYPTASQIGRPLKVPNTRLFTYASLNETPMTVLARQQYMDLPNKNSPGTPTQFFYSPRRDRGWLYLWPVASLSAWAATFTWYRPLQVFLEPNNTMDFPQEWALPLQWILANEWRVGYSIPPARAEEIKDQAKMWYDAVSGWDRESEPVQFGMDYQFR